MDIKYQGTDLGLAKGWILLLSKEYSQTSSYYNPS